MSDPKDAAGAAALAICESLLLAMIDRGILPEQEIVGVLRDAAGAFQQAPGSDPEDYNITVVALINAMLSSVAARPAR